MKLLWTKIGRKKFDKITYIAAIIGPFITIPQIIQIYTTQEVAGLNIYTWSLWIAMSIIRAIHAHQTKDKPLLFNASIFFVTEVIVVAGIMIYR